MPRDHSYTRWVGKQRRKEKCTTHLLLSVGVENEMVTALMSPDTWSKWLTLAFHLSTDTRGGEGDHAHSRSSSQLCPCDVNSAQHHSQPPLPSPKSRSSSSTILPLMAHNVNRGTKSVTRPGTAGHRLGRLYFHLQRIEEKNWSDGYETPWTEI